MAGVTATGTPIRALVAGRYRLGEQLGLGGMGRVYRAQDDLLGREVAVKLLDAEISAGDDGGQVVEEARAAARLSHPGIASVFDGGVHEGRAFVVMELVEGRTLDHLLRDDPPPGPLESAEIAARVADALDYAHGHGVIHCDVKPQNIVVTPDGTPKLVDFGIARVLSTTGGATEQVRGSAPYVAPEQVRGEPIDGRTDVYALGAVLYEMFSGRPPFQGANIAAVIAQRLVADPPRPRSLNPSVPAGLDRVALKALARDPADRYASAGELRDALQAAATGDVASAQAHTERLGRNALLGGQAPRSALAVPFSWPAGKSAVVAALGAVLVAALLLSMALAHRSAAPAAGLAPATPEPIATPSPAPTFPPTPLPTPARSEAPPAPVVPIVNPPPAAPSVDSNPPREEQKKADERGRGEQKKPEPGNRSKRSGRD